MPPTPSFTPTPSFDWSAPPDPAPAPDVPACAPPAAARPKRARGFRLLPADEHAVAVLRARVARLLTGRSTPRRRARGRLPQNTLTVLLDRWEAALVAGVIDAAPDARDGDTPAVAITTGELRLLLRILLAGEWPRLFPADAPIVLPALPRVRYARFLDADADSPRDPSPPKVYTCHVRPGPPGLRD